jgi:hypothetical protein
MRYGKLATIFLATMVGGCGGAPTFDASSDKTANKSMEVMTAKLPDAEKKQFAADTMTLVSPAFMKSAMASAFSKTAKPDTSAAGVFKPLHGLTRAQIHEQAEQIRAARKPPSK